MFEGCIFEGGGAFVHGGYWAGSCGLGRKGLEKEGLRRVIQGDGRVEALYAWQASSSHLIACYGLSLNACALNCP